MHFFRTVLFYNSILGPLQYIMYTNELPEAVRDHPPLPVSLDDHFYKLNVNSNKTHMLVMHRNHDDLGMVLHTGTEIIEPRYEK